MHPWMTSFPKTNITNTVGVSISQFQPQNRSFAISRRRKQRKQPEFLREKEFKSPEEIEKFNKSEESKNLRKEMREILNKTSGTATLNFDGINSRLSPLYPKKVREWIYNAKTPPGFYDTAGSWTTGKFPSETKNSKIEEDQRKEREQDEEGFDAQKYTEFQSTQELEQKIKELEFLIKENDNQLNQDGDPLDMEPHTLEQPDADTKYSVESVVKSLEELWDSSFFEISEKPKYKDELTKQRIEFVENQSYSLSNFPDEDAELLRRVGNDPELLGSIKRHSDPLDDEDQKEEIVLGGTYGFNNNVPRKTERLLIQMFPKELESFIPKFDDQEEIKAYKLYVMGQIESRYLWNQNKRIELLKKRAQLEQTFSLPPPDDLKEGLRFGITQRELDDYAVPPKLRSFLEIKNGTLREKRQYRIRKLFEKFRRHYADTGSPELQVCALTIRIGGLRQMLLLTPKDKSNARALQILINRRKVVLNELKRRDPKTYFQVLKTLPLTDLGDWKSSPRVC